jgi:hypothetical protein
MARPTGGVRVVGAVESNAGTRQVAFAPVTEGPVRGIRDVRGENRARKRAITFALPESLGIYGLSIETFRSDTTSENRGQMRMIKHLLRGGGEEQVEKPCATPFNKDVIDLARQIVPGSTRHCKV